MTTAAQGKYFAYAHGDRVRISISGEVGVIIARADSSRSEDQYYVHYQDARGVATENWWHESALELTI